MDKQLANRAAALALAATLGACGGGTALVVDTGSAAPGTAVARRGQPLQLTGTPIAVGQPLPATSLVDAQTLATVDLAQERGKVLLLSVILSVDTSV